MGLDIVSKGAIGVGEKAKTEPNNKTVSKRQEGIEFWERLPIYTM